MELKPRRNAGACNVALETFTRTSMELKLTFPARIREDRKTFTRTSMELKPRRNAGACNVALETFTRTSMELKRCICVWKNI